MLNSMPSAPSRSGPAVSGPPSDPEAGRGMPRGDDPTRVDGPRGSRVRMSPEDRRRQLVGIGLRTFVEHPVQEVSLDAVAAEAGVSRGLLFHYFPTKTDFHRAVVEAAGRRVLRNVRPDEGAAGDAAVAQIVERLVAQVDRRRDSYLALVYGQAPISMGSSVDGSSDTAGTLREELARLVVAALGLPATALPAVHGWVAYVEDRALQWSAPPEPAAGPGLEPGPRPEAARAVADLVAHCVAAVHALVQP